MKKLLIAALVMVMSGFLVAAPVFANKCGNVETAIISCDDQSAEGGINHVLNLVIDIMMVMVGIVGVIGVTVVGIQYLTAGGNEEKTRKAKRRMFEIVLGIIIFVFMFIALKWLLPGWTEPASEGTSSILTVEA